MAAESILGELSCAICLDPFTDPVTLPCMHSFCKKCVKDIFTAGRGSLQCPECRMDINLGEKGLDGLPKNFTIAKLVEKCKETPKEAKACDVCASSPPNTAVKSCKQCEISYCWQCLTVMHPNRGAFMRHELIDEVLVQDDGPSPAKKCRREESSSELDKNSPVFCPSCSKMITPDKKEIHKRLGHQVVSLEEARKQKQAYAQSCLHNLEKYKEDMMRAITKSENTLEQIPDETRRQLDGLTRCLDRVSEMVTEKKLEFESKIKETSTELTTEKETELSEKRRFYSGDLKEAMSCFDELLEHKDMTDAEFIQAAVILEQRMSAVEAAMETKTADQPLAVDNNVLTQAKLLEKRIQKVLEDKDIPDDHTDGELGDKILKINSALPVWRYKEGCISVNWAWEDGQQNKPVDLRLSCANREIRMNNVSQQLNIDKLDFQTTYTLTLYVDGRLACEAKTVTTLEDVVGKGFLLDAKTASFDVDISGNGKIMDHQENARRQPRIKRIIGAESTRTVDGVYWETKLRFSLRRLEGDGETAFEIGICNDAKLERSPLLRQNKFAYVCGVAKRGRGVAFLEYYSEGQQYTAGRLRPLENQTTWQENFSLHLGYYLNLQKRCFSIVDVEKGTLLHTFDGIQYCDSYQAAISFGEGEHRSDLTVELMTGRDLKSIPNAVFQLL